MADLIVRGGKPLSGTITPSGNKNAVLPMLCATLLCNEPVELGNVPHITDVQRLIDFFISLGSTVEWDVDACRIRLDHSTIPQNGAAPPLPEGMRSSLLLLPALLTRFRRVDIGGNTQGCSLGLREIDPHLEVLTSLGAVITSHSPIRLELGGRFHGARVWQDYMSVTTTENFVMAATLAHGTSTIINAASEPHVQDLCRFLIAMGADIEGVGSSCLTIHGVESLHTAEAVVSSDHHEITTFLAIGAMTGGQIRVENALPEHFDLITRAFEKLGVTIRYEGEAAIVEADQPRIVRKPFTESLLPRIEAAPWPYFPVDLLPLMVALAVRTEGAMQFWNKVYEGGFTWLPELSKFGAHAVVCDPHRIIVFGNRKLSPTTVEAPYIIRAAVALFMVATSIEGQSLIRNADCIRRAHPRFVENLHNLGAAVEWNDEC